jgi:hypothetical protein
MEKNVDYKTFEKKITPYLDGSLSSEEIAEFEAFVLTHSEFEGKVRQKQKEIQLLKQMIPVFEISHETQESIEAEFRSSVFNLLKEEPKGLFDQVRVKWEDWRNRKSH